MDLETIALNDAVEIRPDEVFYQGSVYSTDAAFQIALEQQNDGNPAAALEIYDLVLFRIPRHALAHNNRGVALVELAKIEDALISYNRSIDLKPDYADAYFNRGNLLANIGRRDDAMVNYDMAIAANPNFASAYKNRGNLFYDLMSYGAALADYDTAISLMPEDFEAHNNKGNALRELRRYDDAVASYDAALAIRPNEILPHINRSITFHAMARHKDALTSLDRAFPIQPNEANYHDMRGNILLELNRFEEAMTSYEKALEIQPNYAVAYVSRGNALRRFGHFADAVANFDRAIEISPNLALAYIDRGHLFSELRCHEEALLNFDRAVELQPLSMDAHYYRANSLRDLDRYDEALASYSKAIEIDATCAEVYHDKGRLFRFKGDTQEAERMFRKAIAVDAYSPRALFSLAHIRKYTSHDHPDIDNVKLLLNSGKTSADAKKYLYFSLGKMLDDCGHYDEAFEAYRQGNEICNAAVVYNADKTSASVKSLMDVFNADRRPDCFPSSKINIQLPLFIVGMPRSGTTLLASILSKHSAISTAGEMSEFLQFGAYLPQITNGAVYPEAAKHITDDVASALRTYYEDRLQSHGRRSDARFIIDKHPYNFWHLGFIEMLFPNALVINCVRDPLDACLSIYFQRFSNYHSYSFDLGNIVHFYKQYKAIMEHWKNTLPMKIIDIDYKDTVTRTEEVTRDILGILGLEWENGCLSPQVNCHSVRTASAWQVRQPIYRHSVERWRRYEKHLGPLKALSIYNGS
jgi:tetratricopeptide (TPR) repeat protein